MKVRFIKDCPWSYRKTGGILTRHKEGDTAVVHDMEGSAMVSSGYAEQVKAGRPAVKPEPVKVVAPEETKIVAPKEIKLIDMTKRELEVLGREHGIELDRRHSKSKLIDKLKDMIGGSNE